MLPAASGAAFAHRPAFHHEDIVAGPLTIRPIHTPGHTPEHTSYLVSVDGEPGALFSGGSLLVGSAGRPDLLGPERAEQLARLQYGSVNRLAELPARTGLYPTHGEGSFCTSTAAGRATSTIGAERRVNPVLLHGDVDTFVENQLAGLQPYPTYYSFMGPINLMGPPPMPETDPPVLDPDAVPMSATLIDVRHRDAIAAGRLPAAIPIERSAETGVWTGWLVPHDTPLVLVAEPEQDVEPIVRQLGRIGFDRVVGVLTDVEGWSERFGPLVTHRHIDAADLAARLRAGETLQVLDVRSPGEWETQHLDGSVHCYVPDLWAGAPIDLDPTEDVYVICASGYRATIATGELMRRGFAPVVVTRGGVANVAAARRPAPSRR